MAKLENVYANNKVESTQEEVNFKTALAATEGMVIVETKWGRIPVGGVDEDDIKRGIEKIKELEAKCKTPMEMMAAIQTWASGLEKVSDVDEIEGHDDLVIDYRNQVIYNKHNGEVVVSLPVRLEHKSDAKAMLLALLGAKLSEEAAYGEDEEYDEEDE